MPTFELTDPYAIELYQRYQESGDEAERMAAILRQKLVNEGVDPDSVTPLAYHSDYDADDLLQVTDITFPVAEEG